VFAAFQVGRGDSSIDSCAECYSVSDITVGDQVSVMALSARLWPVAVLTAGVPGANFLTAAATIHSAAGIRAASAILKRSRRKKKVADWLNSH
jgi:hypothetical protein